MIRDPTRGWAWTRALLGLNAKEVHICGEASAIGLVNELAIAAGEEVEVRLWNISNLQAVISQICHCCKLFYNVANV